MKPETPTAKTSYLNRPLPEERKRVQALLRKKDQPFIYPNYSTGRALASCWYREQPELHPDIAQLIPKLPFFHSEQIPVKRLSRALKLFESHKPQILVRILSSLLREEKNSTKLARTVAKLSPAERLKIRHYVEKCESDPTTFERELFQLLPRDEISQYINPFNYPQEESSFASLTAKRKRCAKFFGEYENPELDTFRNAVINMIQNYSQILYRAPIKSFSSGIYLLKVIGKAATRNCEEALLDLGEELVEIIAESSNLLEQTSPFTKLLGCFINTFSSLPVECQTRKETIDLWCQFWNTGYQPFKTRVFPILAEYNPEFFTNQPYEMISALENEHIEVGQLLRIPIDTSIKILSSIFSRPEGQEVIAEIERLLEREQEYIEMYLCSPNLTPEDRNTHQRAYTNKFILGSHIQKLRKAA